jgi:threonine synthase
METPTVATLSNAMDVARPSNLERLRALTGDDRHRLGDEIEAYAVTDAETRRTMARLADEHGYLADPHTAVAFAALERAREAGRRAGRGPAVVLSTAHPGKFIDLVRAVTGSTPPAPPGLRGLAEGPEHVTTIDPRLTALEAVLSESEQG